jgi:hypothetical protein
VEGNAYFQVHPGLRTPELEVEKRLAAERNARRTLAVWPDDQDALRLAVLKQRNYSKGSLVEHDVTRSAYIEPVATVPEHLRRGLARATITEGLRRLQRLGATRAFVGGYETAPKALYASVLSAEHDRSEQWIKEW